MQFFGALPISSDVCDVSDFCDQALSQGGVGLGALLEVQVEV